MDKEVKFYSIGRGNLNLDGKFYYGLDYAITDFMMDLEQQCEKQKEVTDKLKRYINGCLEVSPIEDRSVTDDVLDKEFKYLLKILNEVSE